MRLFCRLFMSTLAVFWLAGCAWCAEPARCKKVLLIGIDGCRFDALQQAQAPYLDQLMAEGAYTANTLILGERYRQSDTVSGPGWSSILTGVWADKHSVDNNKFESPNYAEYPHFFARLKSQQPRAYTASLVNWGPIHQHITSSADVARTSGSGGLYADGDTETAGSAVDTLGQQDPTVLFVYFGQVDEHGHKFGFHPSVPQYIAAIERVDGHIGTILTALKARAAYDREDWLILVTTDHGGRGTSHSDGQNVPEILHSFLIVSGPAARCGPIQEQTYLVDAPVTALTHLGVKIDPAWKLDGRAVGLHGIQ